MRTLIRFTLLLALCGMAWLSYHRLFPPEPIRFEFPELEPQSLPRVSLPLYQKGEQVPDFNRQHGLPNLLEVVQVRPSDILGYEYLEYPIFYLGPTVTSGYLHLDDPIIPDLRVWGDPAQNGSFTEYPRWDKWEKIESDSLELIVDTTQVLKILKQGRFLQPCYPVFVKNTSHHALPIGYKAQVLLLDCHALDAESVATHLYPRKVHTCGRWRTIWLPPQHMAVTTIPVFQSDYFKRYYLSTSYDPCDESVPRSNLF